MVESIFGDDAKHTDATIGRYSESTYPFLCRVKGAYWDQCRDLVDSWLASYPEPQRKALTARLRSGDDEQFASAFWELYLYDAFRRGGWRIEIEPQLLNRTTRPDFLVAMGDVSYYVEARCVFARRDKSEIARLWKVLDAINCIDSGRLSLVVVVKCVGSQPPSIRKLRNKLDAWLTKVGRAGDADIPSGTRAESELEWDDGDWQLSFQAIFTNMPSAQQSIMSCGMAKGSCHDGAARLKKALEGKGSKYGVLPHPLVIAINMGEGFLADKDATDALYGSMAIREEFNELGPELSWVRMSDGYWRCPRGPAHSHVAGVLLASGLTYYSVARCVPTFWVNPSADYAVDPLRLCRVARVVEGQVQFVEPEIQPHDYFNLREDWPTGRPFPLVL